MGAHVVRDREYSPWWDEVVKAVPVGRVGYEALCRSTTPCDGSVGRWTPVVDGLRNILPRGQVLFPGASQGSSPESCSAGATIPLQATTGIPFVYGGQGPPVPTYVSFSAFLEDMDDDLDPADAAVDPPEVPVTRGKVLCARVAHAARLGTLEWEDLKDKAPACVHEGSQDIQNSAEAAVWEVLGDIGTGSPGWNRFFFF